MSGSGWCPFRGSRLEHDFGRGRKRLLRAVDELTEEALASRSEADLATDLAGSFQLEAPELGDPVAETHDIRVAGTHGRHRQGVPAT